MILLMAGKLGILVCNRNNMNHIIGLARSAGKADIKTDIFLTGDGVHLTQHRCFPDLVKACDRLGICEVSYIAFGYKKENIFGLVDKDFVTQMRNADMVEKCDRYIVL
jgi:hypothetical protein